MMTDLVVTLSPKGPKSIWPIKLPVGFRESVPGRQTSRAIASSRMTLSMCRGSVTLNLAPEGNKRCNSAS